MNTKPPKLIFGSVPTIKYAKYTEKLEKHTNNVEAELKETKRLLSDETRKFTAADKMVTAQSKYLNKQERNKLIDFWIFMDDNNLINERIECHKTVSEYEKHYLSKK